jgi:hypothetical protein
MKQFNEQSKCAVVILCLCIVTVVGGNKKLAAQDGCWPATCPNGSHSVCHKECDPNVSPICSPKCVCQCVPDGSSSRLNQNNDKEHPVLAQNSCQEKPSVDTLLAAHLWDKRAQ